MTHRVVVIGAGLIGTMVARALAQGGRHDVTLIEATQGLGRGVSAMSFGWVTQLAGWQPPSQVKFDLLLAGRRAYDGLNAAMREKLFVPGDGALVWRDSPEATEALIAERRALGANVQGLDRAAIQRVAPHLAVVPDLAAHAPDDIFLRPGMAAGRLADSAVDSGAVVVTNQTALGIATESGRVTGVYLAETTVPADSVVLATGAMTHRMLPEGASAPEITTSPSALITLTAEGPAPTLALSGPGLEIRKDRRPDHFLVAAPLRGEDGPTLEALAEEKCQTARDWFPGLRNWHVASSGIGQRPMPQTDTGLIAEETAGVSGLYVAAAHPGVSLAPVVTERILALLS
ncbi:FAD-dependent oxidoreductase [Pseudooceanicola sp.]|uniref:NAD(P)/FAD-dependent oxidoreductase n=1 Tax=Pseudooceanicola sp. TaxID=1914328 RepID=UPI0026184A90|nr:FAD-dependent oxidoreductase [Pseudooceanicola sp.]MDF1854369.1 FAD-dependent oxidoreductase [Pseudooceanicola sp.]